MSHIHVNLTPPPGTNRGSVRSHPTWTMSALERARGFPDKHKLVDKVMWFELTKANINYAKMTFHDATFTGLPEDDFDRSLVRMDRPAFATALPMDPLQKEAFDLSAGKRSFAFYEKPGAGKTKIMLDVAVRLWCEGAIDGLLVVSYKDVHEQWILDEAPKHISKTIPWIGEALRSDKPLVSDVLKPDGSKLRILAVNYEAYATSTKARKVIEDFYRSGNIACVADESHRLMNPESKTAAEMTADQSAFSHRFVASGEPTPRGLENYYAQMRFLDPAILGVVSYAGFKAMFCRMNQHRQIVDYHNTEQLHRLMAPYVHVAAPTIDAEQVFEESRFDLGPAARAAYNSMRDELLVMIDTGQIVTAQGVLPRLTRLSQIACGFLPTDDEGGVQEFGTERVDHTLGLLDRKDPGKAIIWARWQRDHAALEARLGGRSAVYNGLTPPAERREIISRFLDPKDDLDRLIASTAAAGTGLNLQGSSWFNVYHSNSDNAGQRWQSERRTYRRGVDRDVQYWDIIARGTVDNGILRRYRRKRDISDMSIAELRDLISGAEQE